MYRILIVEDDETIAKTICAHLKTWDYEGNIFKILNE